MISFLNNTLYYINLYVSRAIIYFGNVAQMHENQVRTAAMLQLSTAWSQKECQGRYLPARLLALDKLI